MPALKPLLIEIGVEEIPAGVAPRMGTALQQAVQKLLADNGVEASELQLGVTPRRLLLHATSCPAKQHDYDEEIWGPPERVAFADGEPTGAAHGFAKKTGISLDDFELADKGDGKGNYMKAVVHREGLLAADVLADALPEILRKLPSPKQVNSANSWIAWMRLRKQFY